MQTHQACSHTTVGDPPDSGGFSFAGWVQRKWVWQLLFAPLWTTLFINFGLGPIVTRTSDPLPILGNVLGFAAAAALVKFSPVFARATGLTQSGYDNK